MAIIAVSKSENDDILELVYTVDLKWGGFDSSDGRKATYFTSG